LDTEEELKNGSNILGLIVCSIVFGLALARAGEQANIILDFFAAIVLVMMYITHWIIRLTPIGVLFLIAGGFILAIQKDLHKTSKFEYYFSLFNILFTCLISSTSIQIKITFVGQIIEMSDMLNTFEELGLYFMTVFMGFLIQGIILYPTLYGEMFISRNHHVILTWC
jgi:Na+/H+-dicarboxylate symporter